MVKYIKIDTEIGELAIMKKRNDIARSLAMVTQLGVSMLAPVVLCAFVGSWLDDRYGWSVTAVLLILGILAGARNTWILLRQIQPQVSKEKRENEQENK